MTSSLSRPAYLAATPFGYFSRRARIASSLHLRRANLPTTAWKSAERVAAQKVNGFAGLAEKGLGARQFELVFYRVDGTVQRLAVGTSRATIEARHLLRLFAERLDRVDPGFGIELMMLETLCIECNTTSCHLYRKISLPVISSRAKSGVKAVTKSCSHHHAIW